MNTLAFVLAAAIVIASTSIVITQMDFTLSRSAGYTTFENALNSMKRLDSGIRNLAVEAGNSQRLVVFVAGEGRLRVYDDTDTMEYYINRGFSTQAFTEGNINFIYEGGNTTFRVNYTGSIDLKGNASRSGTFFMSLKRNQADISIDII